jgi:hypothetical protein
MSAGWCHFAAVILLQTGVNRCPIETSSAFQVQRDCSAPDLPELAIPILIEARRTFVGGFDPLRLHIKLPVKPTSGFRFSCRKLNLFQDLRNSLAFRVIVSLKPDRAEGDRNPAREAG